MVKKNMSLMKILLGLCVLFTLTTGHSRMDGVLVDGKAPSDSVSQVDPWKRYVVKGEEFSVLLPELPAMIVIDSPFICRTFSK